MLQITALAIGIGAVGAGLAFVLLRLIGLIRENPSQVLGTIRTREVLAGRLRDLREERRRERVLIRRRRSVPDRSRLGRR